MDPRPLFQRPKRKIYISYDHQRDGARYEEFERLFASLYEIVRDNSLEREVGTEDAEAFVSHLREGAMAEAVGVLVLCGASTRLDKFVDWEIKAALDRGIGVVGIELPEAEAGSGAAHPSLPERLRINFDGGYAVLCRWDDLVRDKIELTPRLDFAMVRPPDLIDNSLPLRA